MHNDDLRPWFREDIARVLVSVYFASVTTNMHTTPNEDFRTGFASALSSIAIGIGINPESFLAPDDIKRLQTNNKQEI